MRRVGELAVERLAGARRAGEQQAVDARLGGQRLALLGTADQQPDDAFGNPRLVEAVDQECAGRRRLLGRLEHDRIAGDQRRDDVAVGQVRGEIIGPEHGEHAVRLVAHRDLVAERGFELPLRRALGIGVDRDLDLVDDRADLGPRFPKGLAGLPARSARRTRLPPCARRWRSGAPPRCGRRANARPRPARRRAPRRLRPRHRRSRPTRPARRSPGWSTSAFRHPAAALRHASLLFKLPVHPAPSPRPFAGSLLTLSSNGCQSSRSAIADQIASTSSICIEQGAGVRPIWVRSGARLRPSSCFGERAERLRRIALGARIAPAAPVEEDAVDRRLARRAAP